MWVLVLAGILLLLHPARERSPLPTMLRFAGLLILGWGIFNFLDGVVNHHLLALHNVREDVANRQAWNLGWTVVAGVALPLFGWYLARKGLGAR
jgi:uncharacterized membrane protein